MAEAKWKGLDRAIERLSRFPQDLRTPVREALRQEAEGIAEAMRRAVPVLSGTLRSTIRVLPGPHELSFLVVAGGAATTVKIRQGVHERDYIKGLLHGGNQGEFDYLRAIEFGHMTIQGVLVPPQPFFWPTYRARKAGVKRRVGAAARKQLKTLFPSE